MKDRLGQGLRPLALGDLLDLPYRVYRHRLGLFVLCGILASTADTAATLVWQGRWASALTGPSGSPDPETALLLMFATLPVILLLAVVTSTLAALPIITATRDALVGDDRPGGEVVRESWRRLVPALGAAIVSTVVILAGAAMCLLPAIPLAIGLALTLPPVVLERRSPFAAVGRSWQLVFGRGRGDPSSQANWVRVLVVGIVTLVVMWAFNAMASVPGAVAQMVAAFRGHPAEMTVLGPSPLPLGWMLPIWFFQALVQGVFLPIAIVPWTVVYLDIRTRHEGLDLELALDRLRGEAAP